MSKRLLTQILILAVVVLTVGGIILAVSTYTSNQRYEKEKAIILDDEVRTELSVSLTDICPGQTESYKLRLKANKGDRFDITIDFGNMESDTLAPFIDVEILSNGESISTGKLAEYLEGKQIAYSLEYGDKSEIDVEIIYSMNSDVGDEAQNTVADFDIILSAER